MSNQRLWKVLLLLIVMTLFLAACGSGDTEETATEADTPAETTTDEGSAEVADAPAADAEEAMEEGCTETITLYEPGPVYPHAPRRKDPHLQGRPRRRVR